MVETQAVVTREIRRHRQPFENTLDRPKAAILLRLASRSHEIRGPRFFPDDPAPAQSTSGHPDPIAVAPDLVCEIPQLLVARREAGKAGRFQRRRPDHRGPGANEASDPLQQPRRHGLAFRQDENAVAHAIREHDAPVLHRSPLEQRLRGASVEGIPPVVRRISPDRGGRRPEHLRRTLGGEEADVRHRQALTQHLLAAREITVIRRDHLPPRLRSLPVDAVRPHRHARPAVKLGLMLITMEDDAVDPRTKRPVAQALHHRGMRLPSLGITRGERLRRDNPSTVGMRHRHRLGHGVRGVETHQPELAHRHIRNAAQGEVRARVHVVRLDRKPKPVPAPQLLQPRRVVLHHQFLRGLAQVPKKSLRHLRRPALRDRLTRRPHRKTIRPPAHRHARQRRQVRQQVITAATAELLPKPKRPVLRSHFPAVDVQRGPSRPARRLRPSHFAHQRPHESVEMRVERRTVELVALKSQSRRRRRPGVGPGAGPTQPKDRPFPRRHIPTQPPARRQMSGNLHNRRQIDHRAVRQRGIDRLRRKERRRAGL